MSNKGILKQFEEINRALIEDFLCLPPYNSINNSFVANAYNFIENPRKITTLVTAEVNLPGRRAYQMVYRYRELEIFNRSILEVIEFSTLAFFEGNLLCSYLSLMPVIESLLREWHLTDKSCNKSFPTPANYISNKCKMLKEDLKDNHAHNWLKINIEYLEKVIIKVFCTDHPKSLEHNGIDEDDIFNRNSALHKLTGLNGSNKKIILWIARIFLIIDVIAEVYCRSYVIENEDKRTALTENFKERCLCGDDKEIAKVLQNTGIFEVLQNLGKYEKLLDHLCLDYNQNLFETYFEFYKQAFSDGLNKSRNNFIRNILLNTETC
jgi:hypothetical protein